MNSAKRISPEPEQNNIEWIRSNIQMGWTLLALWFVVVAIITGIFLLLPAPFETTLY